MTRRIDPTDIDGIIDEMLDEIESAVLPQVDEHLSSLAEEMLQVDKKRKEVSRKLDDFERAPCERKQLVKRCTALFSDNPLKVIQRFAVPMFRLTGYTVFASGSDCPFCHGLHQVQATGPNGQTEWIPCSCAKMKEKVFLVDEVLVYKQDGVGLFIINKKASECDYGDYTFFPLDSLDPEIDEAVGPIYSGFVYSTREKAVSAAKAWGALKEVSERPAFKNIITSQAL